jgi:FlaA1/EpsC-like NDP-sugar epimerase
MAKGGDVFVLDMGRPIRIDDLARHMISLMGLTVRDGVHPDGDIEIVYTGLRSAEKLFEELLIGNDVTATDHPMIMRAIEHSIPWPRMQRLLDHITVALERLECDRALALLSEAVTEYQPSAQVRDYVWSRKQPVAVVTDSNVADIAAKRRQAEHSSVSAVPLRKH